MGTIEYRFLMHDPNDKAVVSLTESGKIIAEHTDPLIVRYHELNKKYYLELGEVLNIEQWSPELILMYAKNGCLSKREQIICDTRNELATCGYTERQIVDKLVSYVYGFGRSNAKVLLWLCYGDAIYKNMLRYIDPEEKTVRCIDCDELFSMSVKNHVSNRCPACNLIYKRNTSKSKIAQKENQSH